MFFSKNEVKVHTESVHVLKQFKCDKCECIETSKNLLRIHYEKIHEIFEEFSCDKCDKVFKAASYLKHHIDNVHEG